MYNDLKLRRAYLVGWLSIPCVCFEFPPCNCSPSRHEHAAELRTINQILNAYHALLLSEGKSFHY